MSGACCSSCASGGPCSGCAAPRRLRTRFVERRGRLRPVSYAVGRSTPNDEIAALDASIVQLRADLNSYQPPPGDVTETLNWTKIHQAVDGFVLEWGMFKKQVADSWWWGDDDETKLSTMRNRYNELRQQVLDYTRVHVTAPQAEAPPELNPAYEPPTQEMTVRELGYWIGGGLLLAGVAYGLAVWQLGPYLKLLRKSMAGGEATA